MVTGELPGGTVSLLFTDVEGSTRLLQNLGREAYVRALTQHRHLLREAVTANGGIEVEMQGDSFLFAFPFARQAVAGAVAGQQALREHDWESEPIRVRMGVHTGEPMQADGLYAGLDVHRAARVMSAARGSQVLLSARTADLVDGELPAGAALRDLGEYGLKDFPAPQRLFAVDVEGLSSEPPAGDVPPSRRKRARPQRLVAGAAVLAVLIALAVVYVSTGPGDDPVVVSKNSVAVVDPADNTVVSSIPVGTTPTTIVAGGGAVWTLNTGEGTISRVDVRTRERTRTFSAGAAASDIAFADRSIWVADATADTIRVLDEAGGIETQIPLGIEHAGLGQGRPGFPQVALAAGGGAVWAIGGAGLVAVEMDARSRSVTRRRAGVRGIDADRSPAGPDVAIGNAGVWATAGDDEVFRIDAAPRQTVQLGGFDGDQGVAAVAVDEDVWATGAGVAWQIRASLARPGVTYDVGNRPAGIAIGGGSVWVANTLDGTITRIVVASGSASTITIGGSPIDLVYAGGLVWVSVA